ncbi:transmembrane amino acid transporter protein-domain-containing protein [Gongronella butleri]|nr:transmembrane amino acid transporter protein-domain-containing protein [Gongronella butleri]
MTLRSYTDVEQPSPPTSEETPVDVDLVQFNQWGWGTRTQWEVALNIVNATVGAGIIGLPFALVLAGFVPGIALSVMVAFLTTGAIYSMIVCGRHLNVTSFAALAEATMGSFGFYLLNLMLFIQSAGSCVSYFLLIADTMPVLTQLYLPQFPLLHHRQTLTFLIAVILVYPLNLFRSIGALARWSAFSVLLLPVMVLTVLIRAPLSIGQHETPFFKQGTDPLAAIGIMSFAFVCSQVAFSNYLSQKDQTMRAWLGTSYLSSAISWIVSISFAIVGYVSFGVDANANLFSNFPADDPIINIGRFALALSMVLTVPMAFYPARDAVQTVLYGQRATTAVEHHVLTFVLYAGLLAVGLYVTELGKVYATVGGMASACLAYLIPGYAYWRLFGRRVWQAAATPAQNEQDTLAQAPLLVKRDSDIVSPQGTWLLTACSLVLMLMGAIVMLLTALRAISA